jgi:hypothetical protein
MVHHIKVFIAPTTCYVLTYVFLSNDLVFVFRLFSKTKKLTGFMYSGSLENLKRTIFFLGWEFQLSTSM